MNKLATILVTLLLASVVAGLCSCGDRNSGTTGSAQAVTKPGSPEKVSGAGSVSKDGLDRQALYNFGVWSFGGGDVEQSKQWLKTRNHPLYHFGIWAFGGGDVTKSKDWLKS